MKCLKLCFEWSIVHSSAIFSKVKEDIFTVRIITYLSATESFHIKTEVIETGTQVMFMCLKESQQYSFLEGFYKNPPKAQVKIQNQTIWIVVRTKLPKFSSK